MGASEIASHTVGVVAPECPGVRKFSKRTIAQIAGGKASILHPKDRGSHRSVRIVILPHLAGARRHRQRHGAQPRRVMLAQGLAIAEAQQGGAIINLCGKFASVVLRLGQQGEPAAKGAPVSRICAGGGSRVCRRRRSRSHPAREEPATGSAALLAGCISRGDPDANARRRLNAHTKLPNATTHNTANQRGTPRIRRVLLRG